MCQSFFLSSLGYTSNFVLRSLFQKMTPSKITPPADKRGKHEPRHKMVPETLVQIKQHIQSFNPSVSHYRRKHAPLRLYLPPELTIKEMHDRTSSKKVPGKSVTPCIKEWSINEHELCSLLGKEACEDCEEYKLHGKFI